MKNIDILDSWRLVKFITDLHNHPHSIKGDFGHIKELENLIVKDIEQRRVKFDDLVNIANCIFTHNLCSNKIQSLVENELINTISDFNRIDFDIGKFIKLIKSLKGYYIKNEELCDSIKNILETYLNAYLKDQEEIISQNQKHKEYTKKYSSKENIDNSLIQTSNRKISSEKKILKKLNKEENMDDSNKYGEKSKSLFNNRKKDCIIEDMDNEEDPEIIVEKVDEKELEDFNLKSKSQKIKTINYEFMEKYNKIITNISVIFWSLSNNEKFNSLKNNRDDYKYFFSRIKDITIKNIEFYNEREITFILKALYDLNIPLLKSENKNFTKKISKLENFTLHDRITLLELFLYNEIEESLDLIIKFIEKINKNFKNLTYSDMIRFLDLTDLIPNLISKFLLENNSEKVNFIEKRFNTIIQNREIDKLCKLFSLTGKLHEYFNEGFLININNILYNRINEIPKEYFCKILFNSINFSSYSISIKLFDILEDLSNFENIKEIFLNFEDLNYLLWASLNFSKLKTSEIFSDENKINLDILGEKLVIFSRKLIINLIELDNFTLIQESKNIQKKERILNFQKHFLVETLNFNLIFLFSLILKKLKKLMKLKSIVIL